MSQAKTVEQEILELLPEMAGMFPRQFESGFYALGFYVHSLDSEACFAIVYEACRLGVRGLDLVLRDNGFCLTVWSPLRSGGQAVAHESMGLEWHYPDNPASRALAVMKAAKAAWKATR